MSNHEMRMFVTVEGLEVKVRPVAQYLIQKVAQAAENRLRQAGRPLDPPTYTVTTVSGAVETHVHDETTLQTDEDRAAWAAHQEALAEAQAAREEATTRVYLLRGLDIGSVPPEWKGSMEALGLDVPTDENEQLLEYMQTEILKTPEDIIRAMMAVARLSSTGAPQEDLDAAEASFRRALQRARSPERASTEG